MSDRAVDPSISKTPLPTDAQNLATVCVLCSHNCGLRVDVVDGRIADVRADESSPISQRLHLQQGLLDRPLRRAQATGRAPAEAPRRRHLRAHRLGPGDQRDRRAPVGDPRRAFAARDRPRRHRRPGEPHGRAVRAHLPLRARLEALVQRLRAGEDAALPHRPVDVRCPAVDVLPPRHREHPLPVDARHQPEDLQPRPQRDRHVQGVRRQPASRRWSCSTRATPRRRAPPTATCGSSRAPTPTCCSAWRRRSCRARGSSTRASSSNRRSASRRCARRSARSTSTRWRAAPASRPPICSTSRATTPAPSRRRSCSISPSSRICSRP